MGVADGMALDHREEDVADLFCDSIWVLSKQYEVTMAVVLFLCFVRLRTVIW